MSGVNRFVIILRVFKSIQSLFEHIVRPVVQDALVSLDCVVPPACPACLE